MEGDVGQHPDGWGVYASNFGDVLCSDKHAKGSPTSARYSGGSWRLVEGFTKATAFPILAGRSYTLTFWVYSDYDPTGASYRYYAGSDCFRLNSRCKCCYHADTLRIYIYIWNIKCVYTHLVFPFALLCTSRKAFGQN
jgi:hypothetical protein